MHEGAAAVLWLALCEARAARERTHRESSEGVGSHEFVSCATETTSSVGAKTTAMLSMPGGLEVLGLGSSTGRAAAAAAQLYGHGHRRGAGKRHRVSQQYKRNTNNGSVMKNLIG